MLPWQPPIVVHETRGKARPPVRTTVLTDAQRAVRAAAEAGEGAELVDGSTGQVIKSTPHAASNANRVELLAGVLGYEDPDPRGHGDHEDGYDRESKREGSRSCSATIANGHNTNPQGNNQERSKGRGSRALLISQ